MKVTLSCLKQVCVRDTVDTVSARVSAIVTSIDATWTMVDGVRGLDEVRVEFHQRSDSTTTVRCTIE